MKPKRYRTKRPYIFRPKSNHFVREISRVHSHCKALSVRGTGVTSYFDVKNDRSRHIAAPLAKDIAERLTRRGARRVGDGGGPPRVTPDYAKYARIINLTAPTID